MKSLLLILGLVYTLFGGTYDYVYTAKDKVDANETAKSLDFLCMEILMRLFVLFL